MKQKHRSARSSRRSVAAPLAPPNFTHSSAGRGRLAWYGAVIVALTVSFLLGNRWGWGRREKWSGSPQFTGQTATAPSKSPPLPLAGEFEAQSAIILNPYYLLTFCPEVFEQLVVAITENTRLICLTPPGDLMIQADRILDRLGLGDDKATLVHYPLNSSWVRDYGPLFLNHLNGSVTIADLRYDIDSDSPHREKRWFDDKIPEVFGGVFGLPVRSVPLWIEGGNLLSNGQGLYVSTSLALLAMNEHVEPGRPVGAAQSQRVFRALGDYLGAEKWRTVRLLPDEPTGHIDMFATFTSPDSVVVAQCDPDVNPDDAETLDFCARILAQETTALGPLRVSRIPMPPRAKDNRYRSYTNVLYANGTLIVPSFEDVDPEVERYVIETYTRLLPGWKITPIRVPLERGDASYFHCMTRNIPAFVSLPDFARVGRLK